MTTENELNDDGPATAPGGTSRTTLASAIAAVALVAAGAAIAATKLHTGSKPAVTATAAAGGGGAPSTRGSDGRPTGRPGGFGRGAGRGGGFGGLSTAATYLGLSTSQLFADLQSGKTLGSIAAATPGKSVDGLVAAMVASEKSSLQAAVSSGRLTQSQADSIVSSLSARITAMVNGGFGGRRGFGFPGGPGGPGGGGQQSPTPPGVT